MKIFDCFTFYNEFDLLELRLRELYDHVDHFIIVEGNRTFQNQPKPLHYIENQERYAQWADKIRHVAVVDMPDGDNAWVREEYQRNAIKLGIGDAKDDDIIIVSDCDEIIRPYAITRMRNSNANVFGLRMPLYNFKFNYMRTTPGQYDVWAMAARKALMNSITPNELRAFRFSMNGMGYQETTNGNEVIEHAGWHFGYLGDKEYLIDKAKSFSHTEVNTPEFLEQIDIEASIRDRKEWNRNQPNKYEIVQLDDYFPKSVKDYPEFVLPDATVKSTAFLPPYP